MKKEINKKNKNIVVIVVLVVASLLLVGLLLWNALKDEEMSTEKYEAQQLELFEAAMAEDIETARGMDYEAAQDYFITSLYENQRTYSSDSVDLAANKLSVAVMGDTSGSTSGLLDGLSSMLEGFDLGSLLGGLLGGGGDITRTITMKSNTVCQSVSDSKYCVDKLSANVYITDVNSSKWAVLVHPFMTSGSLIYGSIGGMYEEQGYNILAPDLRGFGNSDGSVAMGYLESLDIYDWIKDLDSNWNNANRYGVSVKPDTIVVHGISLGGATTLQLATNPDIAAANGREPYTKTLTQLNVKGFVDDCGYTSMSGIITGMLSGGSTSQMSSLFGAFDISKMDFMSELENVLGDFNLEGFGEFDFTSELPIPGGDTTTGGYSSDYYEYFEQFSEQFGNMYEGFDNYTGGSNQYQNQIPGVDLDAWNSLADKYSSYGYDFGGNSMNDLLTGLKPTNNTGSATLMPVNNTSGNSSNVLDGVIGTVLMNLVGVGLTEENYDKYSNVFSNGRHFPAGSKVVIIHGTADTTVPHSNADTVAANVSPATLVHKWDAEGQPHAFVVVGSNKSEYSNLIANFTDCVNNSSCTSISR